MTILSIVLPCLNEEKTVEVCIKKCYQLFETLQITGEVIVSDNGSTDRTAEIAKSFGANVTFCAEKGYGNALRHGFSVAKGKYVVMVDCDNTYDILELDRYYEEIIKDDSTDMVIGARLKGNIKKGAMPFLHRYLGTPVLTFILNLLYGTRITDSQCGMRMMKHESLKKIQLKTTGMEFASELLVQFAKKKFKIKEVPISLHPDIEGRKPHLNPWRDGMRHLIYLIKNRF